ncbi:MAG: hypothetical protein AAF631_03600 [Pseudomonadota bacterium]
MKTIVLGAALMLTPLTAYAMGCGYGSHQTAASCPVGQTWDSESSSCIPTTS